VTERCDRIGACPRATKDIDLLLEDSADNLARPAASLDAFGAPRMVDAARRMAPDEIVYLASHRFGSISCARSTASHQSGSSTTPSM
jgi:hypothetical protein